MTAREKWVKLARSGEFEQAFDGFFDDGAVCITALGAVAVSGISSDTARDYELTPKELSLLGSNRDEEKNLIALNDEHFLDLEELADIVEDGSAEEALDYYKYDCNEENILDEEDGVNDLLDAEETLEGIGIKIRYAENTLTTAREHLSQIYNEQRKAEELTENLLERD